MRPDINFTPKMTPNGRPCTPSKYFNHAGTRWGANNFGKSGGGRSNFKILWLDHEIPKFLQDFLSIAIRVKIGFRTLPESSNIFVGVTPPHLAGMFAPCGAIWHTSSKGMPRHAHGRWALVRVCGVDVTDVTLSWWCVRWLVRKILE